MYMLWTAVATTMLQRLKVLKDVLGLYLNRQKGMALLEQVQASDLSDEDRARVSHIIRTMLRLPDDSGQEPSSPEASDPSANTSRRRQRARPDLAWLDKVASNRYTCLVACLVPSVHRGGKFAKDAW